MPNKSRISLLLISLFGYKTAVVFFFKMVTDVDILKLRGVTFRF